jgi:hypothetical protein
MSVTDDYLANNRAYAATFTGHGFVYDVATGLLNDVDAAGDTGGQ